jgi:ABC-type uncharacterized transport system permease subunit
MPGGWRFLCQQQAFSTSPWARAPWFIGLASVIIATPVQADILYQVHTAGAVGSILYKGMRIHRIVPGLDSGNEKMVTAALFMLILVAGSVGGRGARPC